MHKSDRSILTACQPVLSYLMTIGYGTAFIIYSYLDFLCICFLRVSCSGAGVDTVLSNNKNFLKYLFDTKMRYKQLLPLWVKVDLEVISKKEYYTFPSSPKLETHFQIQFSIILRTPILRGSYSLQEMKPEYPKVPQIGLTRQESSY